MPLARASELDRLLVCPGSKFLPTQEEFGESMAAAWGTAIHKWKVSGILPGNKSFRATLQRKIEKSGIQRTELWPVGGKHELTVAYNVLTRSIHVREQTSGLGEQDVEDWKMAFGDEYIVGTLDYIFECFDTPWLDDLKTGRFVEYKDYRAQQYFYAMVWSKLIGARSIYSTITHWPKYPLHIKPHTFGLELDHWVFDTFQAELSQFRETVLYARETQDTRLLVVSPKCVFCPSQLNCVAYKSTPEETL